MPRKFRLSTHRKNEFRKKRAAKLQCAPVQVSESVQVSQSVHEGEPGILSTPQSLVISLPLTIVNEASAPTFDILQQRVQALLTLPKGAYFFNCLDGL